MSKVISIDPGNPAVPCVGGAPIHLDESYTMVDHPLFDGSHYTLNELLY